MHICLVSENGIAPKRSENELEAIGFIVPALLMSLLTWSPEVDRRSGGAIERGDQ